MARRSVLVFVAVALLCLSLAVPMAASAKAPQGRVKGKVAVVMTFTEEDAAIADDAFAREGTSWEHFMQSGMGRINKDGLREVVVPMPELEVEAGGFTAITGADGGFEMPEAVDDGEIVIKSGDSVWVRGRGSRRDALVIEKRIPVTSLLESMSDLVGPGHALATGPADTMEMAAVTHPATPGCNTDGNGPFDVKYVNSWSDCYWATVISPHWQCVQEAANNLMGNYGSSSAPWCNNRPKTSAFTRRACGDFVAVHGFNCSYWRTGHREQWHYN